MNAVGMFGANVCRELMILLRALNVARPIGTGPGARPACDLQNASHAGSIPAARSNTPSKKRDPVSGSLFSGQNV